MSRSIVSHAFAFVVTLFTAAGAFAQQAEDQRPVVDASKVKTETATNAQFSTFAKATGYITTAEREGWSAVFHLLAPGGPARVGSDVPWWAPR